jgi:hypothetical protein
MSYEDMRKEMKRELRRELWQLREGIMKDLPRAVADHLDRNALAVECSPSPGQRSHSSTTRRSPGAQQLSSSPELADNVTKRLCEDMRALRREVREVHQGIGTLGERFRGVEDISECLQGIDALGERLQGVEELSALLQASHAKCVLAVPPEPFAPVFPQSLPNAVGTGPAFSVAEPKQFGSGLSREGSSESIAESDKPSDRMVKNRAVSQKRGSQRHSYVNKNADSLKDIAALRSCSQDMDEDEGEEEDDPHANDKLLEVLLKSEEIAAREEKHAQTTYTELFKDFFFHMNTSRFETCLEVVIGAVIMVNAFFIGIEMNYDRKKYPDWYQHGLFKSVNIFVCILFTTEILIKLKIHGFASHFCGSDPKMNILDAVIVLADIIQLSQFLHIPLPPALFRLVRLVRLVRLLRVIRSAIFADLLSMVQGIIGAMVTLVWALVLLLFMVYFFSLLFFTLYESESPIGDGNVEHVTYYFENVPRSFLTTYRCAFGDCSTENGTPIFEMIYNDEKSRNLVIVFCCFGFFFWVGLFNVIAAIFVESTMAAANKLSAQKKSQRLSDEELWAKNVGILIDILWLKDTEIDNKDQGEKLSERLADVAKLDLPCSDFQEAALTPEACQALLNLDICEEDHTHIADILDPDNGGTICVLDMMDGLSRLRGEPRRSDIVTIDLMVRSLQEVIGELHKDIKKIDKHVLQVKKNMAHSNGLNSPRTFSKLS